MARSRLAGLGVASGADPAAWWAPCFGEEAVSLSLCLPARSRDQRVDLGAVPWARVTSLCSFWWQPCLPGVISLTLSLLKFQFCPNWGCTVPLSGLCNGALHGTRFSFSVTVSTGSYEVIRATGWSESACE